jgi:hypothetical protein
MKDRCLTNEQVEEMAVAGGQVSASIDRHLAGCEKCRARISAATEDEQLVGQLRELRDSRARIAHLIPADPTTFVPAR